MHDAKLVITQEYLHMKRQKFEEEMKTKNKVQSFVDMKTVAKARLEIYKVRKEYQRGVDPNISKAKLKVTFLVPDL